MKFFILLTICLSVAVFVRAEEDDVSEDNLPEPGPGDVVLPTEKPEHPDDEVVGTEHASPTFNERLDQIIKDTIAKHHREIVPYRMKDQKTSFWRKIGPLNLTGEAGFINNTLDGLVNMRRQDDAFLGRTKWGNVEMTLNLQVGPLELNTNGYAKFLNIGPHVSYKITVASVDASAVLHFNSKTDRVAVKSFKVTEMLGLKFQITKSPGFITPFVANQIIKGGLSIFKPLIRNGVTRAGAVVLDQMISDSQFVKDVMLEADKM